MSSTSIKGKRRGSITSLGKIGFELGATLTTNHVRYKRLRASHCTWLCLFFSVLIFNHFHIKLYISALAFCSFSMLPKSTHSLISSWFLVVFLLAFKSIISSIHATNYYFSSSLGQDIKNGSSIKSLFRSLASLRSLSSTGRLGVALSR